MKIGKTLYLTSRKKWRGWLKKHYKIKKEIWLIFYKKNSGKPRIPYNDAVEEALCFGWIDSIVKTIGKNKFAQRFSPRRTGSPMSEMNKERVRRLIKLGKMTEDGLIHAGNLYSKFKIPKHILNPLKKNKLAWKNFKRFPLSYKRIRIAYIENYHKNSEMFRKALANFIGRTEKNRKFGMVK